MTGACLAIVASLTFLGIGVVPPEPTWGGLLATDLKNLYDRPFGPLAPAGMIIATVWALNALADVMRDVGGKRQPDKRVTSRSSKKKAIRRNLADQDERPVAARETADV